MLMAVAEERMYLNKIVLGLPGQIERYEIMLLVDTAWDQNFSNIDSNKKDIYKRGWTPLNCIILNDQKITRNTSTKDAQEEINLPHRNPKHSMGATVNQVLTPILIPDTTAVPAS